MELRLRGCRVVGIDPSVEMIEQARRQNAEAGMQVDYLVGTAEATGLAGGTYDVFSAGQCWHWFDRPSAATEARRLLRPGGAIVICHFDWLPLPGSVSEATESLVLQHNPKWGGAGGSGMYPAWAADVSGAGFTGIETFSYDVEVPLFARGMAGPHTSKRRRGGVFARRSRREFRQRACSVARRALPRRPRARPAPGLDVGRSGPERG